MKVVLLIKIVFLTLALVKAEKKYAIGDPRACGGHSYMFEVLPGFGWDNLVNENRGVVVNFNYSRCRTTEDGRYLIPDGIVTLPIKTSHMNVFSKIFDHWKDYETDTSFSINREASGTIKAVTISGSFSSEFENVKSHQIEDHAVTTKVQARYVRYKAKILPDIQLDPDFRLRVLKIANHIQNNRKYSSKYESELLIRDFGTHVLTTVDAGASIVKVDQLKSSVLEDKDVDKFKISMAAGVSVLGLVNANASYGFSISKKTIDKYNRALTNSDIRTYGGQALNPENFTLGKWTSNIENDLVPIDRDGYPLDYVLTRTSLPELSANLVEEVVQSVRGAIELYYKHNTYPGCTNTDAPNFSFIANTDDGTCHTPVTNLTFGGVFQICQFTGKLINNENLCNKLTTKHPKTQGFSCPEGYDATLIHKGETSKVQHEHKCHKCWIFFHCCHDYSYQGKATYKSYWCHAKPDSELPQNSGYLFGGLFSDQTSNFVTRSKSCPQYYNAMTITSKIKVCISDDYELGTKSAVPFGGFYSCMHGNPLVKSSNKKTCPTGFSNHLATMDNFCEVMYCAQTGALSELKFPRVQVPPYTSIPAESLESTADYVISRDGTMWMQLIDPESKGPKPEEGKWTELQSDSNAMNTLREKLNANHVVYLDKPGISRGEVAGISIGATTLACVIVGVCIAFKRKRTRFLEYTSLLSES